jgi:hypothetical protein
MFGGLTTVHVEFTAIPLDEETGFRCIPDGGIGFESAKQIARELCAGRVKGQIEGHRWFRQAGS